MSIRTNDLVDLRNGDYGNYTLLEFSASTFNVYVNSRFNALRDTEREIIKTHKLMPIDSKCPLGRIEYKNQFYFGFGNSEKTVTIKLQKSFYPVMDQWIAEYKRLQALIVASQVFLDDLFRSASSEPEVIALLPRVFYHYRKHKPVFNGQVIYTGKIPLSSHDIEQFAHKHSEIISQFKVIQLDQMTR